MNTADIVLPEEKYQFMCSLCQALMDPFLRTVLLCMIEDGGWITGAKMTMLMGLKDNNGTNKRNTGRMVRLLKLKIVDMRAGERKNSFQFRVNSDRLFFLNQFIQTYNKLK